MADEMTAFFASLVDSIGVTPEDRAALSEQYDSSNFQGKLALVQELQELQRQALEEASAEAGGRRAGDPGIDDGRGYVEEAAPQEAVEEEAGGGEEVNLVAVDAAWRTLLSETLPQEKQVLLQRSYDAEPSPLRKPTHQLPWRAPSGQRQVVEGGSRAGGRRRCVQRPLRSDAPRGALTVRTFPYTAC